MKIVEPSYKIMSELSEDGLKELQMIEKAARTCYKSEGRIISDGNSARALIKGLLDRGHEAMLEHGGMTVKFVCDRGVSHELVRHRMASFAQESTRYCNYSKNHFGHEITVIDPSSDSFEPGSEMYNLWRSTMLVCESAYMEMLEEGYTPQEARCVLPNSLKTEVVITANWREWRHIFQLRCAKDAHPDMRRLMIPLLNEMKSRLPIIFDDIDAEAGE